MDKNRNRGKQNSQKNFSQEGAFRKKKRPKDHFRGKSFNKASGPTGTISQGSAPQEGRQEHHQDRRSRSAGTRQGPGSLGADKAPHPRPQAGKDYRNQNLDEQRQDKPRKHNKHPPGKPSLSRSKEHLGKKPVTDVPSESRLKLQAALEAEEKNFKHVAKKYDVLIYDTLAAAHLELNEIRTKALDVDQLNVVIRAEASMDDPLLAEIPHVKVFAGAAWTLIHERRIQDGWYQRPQ